MGELEYFIECMLKRDPTNTTLNISQPYIITNMTQIFKEDVKSLMTFNTPNTPHTMIVGYQEKYTKV